MQEAGIARYPELEPDSRSMMKTKLTLFVTVIAAALFGVGCVGVPKPDVTNAIKWNGHWYVLITESLSWQAAKEKCEQLGGHLAYVETEAENQFLSDILKKSKSIQIGAWLGGTDGKKEGDWFWLNGKPITTTFWANGPGPDATGIPQPDNARGNENHLVLWKSSGTWNDSLNTNLKDFICEWE